ITAFRNIRSTNTPFFITIDKAIERIKEGKSKELIEKIRKEEDKAKRDKLKTNLPSICFGGKFTQRSKDKLEQSSGYMVADYDDISNKVEFDDLWTELINIPYTYLVFRSPSFGVSYGLKAVIKIPKEITAKRYTEIFKQFQERFPSVFWDSSNSDISRVCYECYDPDLYVNTDAKTFDPIIEDKGFEVVEKVPFIPVNDEDYIIEKIMNFNWKKDFVEGERNSFIFDLAGAFCEYGVSKSMAEGYIINNVVIGDFSEKEAK